MGKFYQAVGEELTLYVRHCAWLNAVPEKREGDKSKTPYVPRGEKMNAAGMDPGMPPLDAPYLLGYFWEVGPTMPGGMGEVPLTFHEIQAWQEQIGIDLQPWEARIIRRLSCEYLNQSNKATKLHCEAPWEFDGWQLVDRLYVAGSLEDSMDGLMEL